MPVTSDSVRQELTRTRPNSLREITACLAHSVGYLGSSFHGCIVASAFHRPSQLVVRHPQPKHQDAANLLLSSAPPLRSWLDVDPRVFPEMVGKERSGIKPQACEKVDEHWERVQDVLTRRPSTDKKSKMNAFRVQSAGADPQTPLSLEDYDSLIEPLKEANVLGLLHRCAALRARIDKMEDVYSSKRIGSWIRRSIWAIRAYR